MPHPYYSVPWRLARLREGPLGPFLDAHAGFLHRLGYAYGTAHLHLQMLHRLSRWLGRRTLSVRDLNEQLLDEFVRSQSRRYRTAGNRAPLQLLLQHLRGCGAVADAPAPTALTPSERLVREFTRHLINDRGLSPETIAYYVPLVRRFLQQSCGAHQRPVRALSPKDVSDFVHHLVQDVTFSVCRKSLAALRTFLRFLHSGRMISADLTGCVPATANWRLASLPVVLQPRELQQLLRHCDRRTPQGRRDYAVLLLLMRLGLRSGEVMRLTLDDLDWEQASIIVRGKGGQLGRLPLPDDVGQALAVYLQRDRPACSTRRVFVRTRAPYMGWVTASAVGRLVLRAFQRAGLRPSHRGSHVLRHTLATQLLHRGRSLSEVGQILRHRHPDTTAIYAKVHLDQLRTAAAPWLGGAR